MRTAIRRWLFRAIAVTTFVVAVAAVAYESNGWATVSGTGFDAEANITASMFDSLEYSTIGAYTQAWGPLYNDDEYWDSAEVPGTASAASIGSFSSQAYGFANYCVAAQVALYEIGGGWSYYPEGYDCEVMAI